MTTKTWDPDKFKRFIRNRYTYLFLSILAIFVIHPLSPDEHVILSIFFMLMMLAVLWTLDMKKWMLITFLCLAVISFASSILSIVHTTTQNPKLDFDLLLADIITYIIFLFGAVVVLLFNIFSEKKITKRTILGGISVYFLMGIFWAFCYQLVFVINPKAFMFTFDKDPFYFDFLFFSFTTLTTLGYGDILPISYHARSLAMLESTLGPIFLAVFIARLVGLHISQSKKD